MSELFNLPFDAIAISSLTCLVLREVFLAAIPSRFAGPGGRFFGADPSA